jgi:hypothetical protein
MLGMTTASIEFRAALMDVSPMPTSFSADPSNRQYTDGSGHIEAMAIRSILSGSDTVFPAWSTTVREAAKEGVPAAMTEANIAMTDAKMMNPWRFLSGAQKFPFVFMSIASIFCFFGG